MARTIIRLDFYVVSVICLACQSLYSLYSASASASSVQKSQRYACYPPDRDALLDVAASLQSDVLIQQYWTQEQDCCSWMGVTCAGSTTMLTSDSSAHPQLYSRVAGLKLEGISSSSSMLSMAICRLSALILLDLSLNGLVGPIPTCFSHNLTSLQTLILSQNSLSGSLSPLSNLSLLTHLDLSFNQFTSVQASPIIFRGKLTYLDLSFNVLNCALSTLKLHTLGSLEYLDLKINSLSGTADITSNFINGLSTNLRYLDLSSNPLLSISLTPAAFSTTPLLAYLGLYGIMPISGDIRVLEHLQHLETLRLTMSIPASGLGSLFCKLESLQSLWVEAPEDSEESIVASTVSERVLNDKLLCEKPVSVNLTTLYLDGQGYTGPFPAWIAHFAGLQLLTLTPGSKFEGPIPQEWQALTQLTQLSLSGDSPATFVPLSQELQSWLFRLPLTHLELQSMGLTSEDFPCAGFSFLNHTLISLDLSDNHISAALLLCLQGSFLLLEQLKLSKNPLASPLRPHMILASGSLQSLDLSNCQLVGSLSSIGTLRLASAYINLAHNNLTGSIPSHLINTALNANTLDLSHNNFTGELVLQHYQPLRGLGELIASHNYLSKISFYNVSHLDFLDLSSNQLGGTLESLLGDYSVMKNLTVLLLQNNQLKGSIPGFLGVSAPSLITLDLSNNKLTGAIPPGLQHLRALQSKIPEGPSVGALYAYTLERVKNMDFNVTYYSRGHLDLSHNRLDGPIPDGLGALLGLHDLILSGNNLSGPIPPSLAHLASLETLDLSFNNLEGAIPSELLKLTSLEVFNVSFNPELNGQIPEGSQLETVSSFEGDPKLCGQVIQKRCPMGEQLLTPTGLQKPPSNTLKEKTASFILKEIQEWIAIPGLVLGHVVGMAFTVWALKRLHFFK